MKLIEEYAASLPTDAILICGCQDGSEISKYIIGKKVFNSAVYKVSRFSYQYVIRTAAYVVTRQSAKRILAYHAKNLVLADNWSLIFSARDSHLLFANILSHPNDLTSSNIEQERSVLRRKNAKLIHFMNPLSFASKFFNRIIMRTIKIAGLKLAGYQQIVKASK